MHPKLITAEGSATRAGSEPAGAERSKSQQGHRRRRSHTRYTPRGSPLPFRSRSGDGLQPCGHAKAESPVGAAQRHLPSQGKDSIRGATKSKRVSSWLQMLSLTLHTRLLEEHRLVALKCLPDSPQADPNAYYKMSRNSRSVSCVPNLGGNHPGSRGRGTRAEPLTEQLISTYRQLH